MNFDIETSVKYKNFIVRTYYDNWECYARHKFDPTQILEVLISIEKGCLGCYDQYNNRFIYKLAIDYCKEYESRENPMNCTDITSLNNYLYELFGNTGDWLDIMIYTDNSDVAYYWAKEFIRQFEENHPTTHQKILEDIQDMKYCDFKHSEDVTIETDFEKYQSFKEN